MPGSSGRRLTTENDAAAGVVVEDRAGEREIRTKRGVVLACGGLLHNLDRLARVYPHVARGSEHVSPTPESNNGDGIRLAETAGGLYELRLPNAAAWMPVSKVPRRGGTFRVFPHLLDRYKPGVIAVNRKGRRF